MKMCPRCKTEKEEACFKRARWCRQCVSDYNKQYRRSKTKEQKEQDNRKRNETIASGICGSCRQAPLDTKTMCRTCADKMKLITLNYRKTKEGALKELIKSARSRAKQKSMAFDLDYDWLCGLFDSQGGKCKVTGLPLDFETNSDYNKINPRAPSLDRIDTNRGYTKENVRLVCAQVNLAINWWGIEKFYEMCYAAIKEKQ